jgi:hypothetical protein
LKVRISDGREDSWMFTTLGLSLALITERSYK